LSKGAQVKQLCENIYRNESSKLHFTKNLFKLFAN